MSYQVQDILEHAFPVMPVLAVARVEDAQPLARALKAGGLTVLEVTLRTSAAIDVIAEMKKVEGIIVGAGTVTRVEQLKQLEAVGADFAISPGATPRLLEAGQQTSMPLEMGYEHFKFFPAAASGGVSALKAFAGPFPDVKFCPTGGISVNDFTQYLALSNVVCVGGSWVVPADALNQGDWARIEQLAREACELAKQS